MCLIIFKPKNVAFNLKHIENALVFNSDGMGISIRDNETGQVKVYRNLDFETLEENAALLTSKECVLHLRYGTSGKKSWRQMHPFKIAKKTDSRDFELSDDEKILFHNGVMFSPSGQFSDTQIFARGLFNIDAGINKHVTGNRFLVQDNKENYFYGQWVDIEGMKYSNASYHNDYKTDYRDNFFQEFYDSYTCPCCGGYETELISFKHELYECYDCNAVFSDDKILI